MVAVTKIDLTREAKQLYAPPAGEPELVDVPEFSFLMIDGRGDPKSALAFGAATEALYGVSYALKFALKRATGLDYRVMPLEGLFWTDAVGGSFDVDRSLWCWTLMIRQPAEATPAQIQAAIAQTAKKKPSPELARLRCEPFREGLAAQVMHIGPYAAERPTIDRLHAFIAARGYVPYGKHHELYLGDPMRTAPEKLRTVLRHPVRPRA